MTNFRNAMMAAAHTASASGVTIANSALFDASSSTDGLSYTTDGSGFNQKTFTLSTWFYLGSDTSSIGGVGWPIFAADHGSANSETTWWKVRINTNGTLVISNWDDVTTTQVFRDIGWYNLVIATDTTQSTAADRYKVYVNGERITSFSSTSYPSQNIDLAWGEPSEDHWIGNYDNANYAYNGYLAETVFKSGSQLGPESFGEFDSTGTFWTPLSSTSILAGSPTFYLDNATNPQTDASGNGINWTNNGSIATSTHTPTNIFSTLNPLMSGSTGTFSSGNRTATLPPTNTSVISSMAIPSTGKWYCEFRFATIHGYAVIGVSQMDASSWLVNSASYFSATPAFTEEGTLFTKGTQSGTAITVTTNTTYGAMWDADNSILKITDGTDTFQCGFTVNDTSVPLGFQFAISSGSVTGNVSVNFGDPPFAISSGNTDGNGQGNFEFAPPSGYLALNTANLAEAVTLPTGTIDDHFRTILYTGNGSTQTITTTIRPDFIWTKNRTSSGPAIVDAVRGATKSVQTNSQGAEFTSSNSITSLGSSGYDLGSDGDHGSFNDNGDAHVAWVAQLGGVPSATNSAGAGATPTAGSVKIDNSNYGSALAGTIPVTKLSASTELGMSCISYTGNGSAGATFFHGLGVIPEFFIVKRLDTSGTDWIVYHSALGATKNLVLNNTGIGSTSATRWNNTEPTSTLISLGTTTAVNGSGSTYICYAFAPSAFCMVTSWLGNNNSNGTFVPTLSTLSDGTLPMEPQWALIKQSSSSGQNWYMYDRVRDPINPMTRDLRANAATAESGDSSDSIDFLTSGIKFYSNHSGTNAAQTYVALIFGQPIISEDKLLLAGR